MRIPLELPPGAEQHAFLDQFNAALRAVSPTGSGSAGFDVDGNFRTTSTSVFAFEGGETSLTWAVVKTPDGTLTSVEAEPLADATPPDGWEDAVYRVVTSAFAATLSDRRRFFRRVTLNYIGPALDGEYWLPGFRLAPLFPDDEQPALMNAERVVSIDMLVDAIDDENAWSQNADLGLLHDWACWPASGFTPHRPNGDGSLLRAPKRLMPAKDSHSESMARPHGNAEEGCTLSSGSVRWLNQGHA